MTDPEKPLHVRVAEALGTKHMLGPVIGRDGGRNVRRCTIHQNDTYAYDFETDYDGRVLAPRYDTDWAAAGPLIEKYEITLLNCGGGWSAAYKYDVYGVYGEVESHEGSTPLEVVCNLILSLHAAGKLEAK